MARPRVTVVGLGPAGPELTTAGARTAIIDARAALLRTARHPAAVPLLGLGNVTSLDGCYERGTTYPEVYGAIVAAVVAAAHEHGAVVYAVPGSPVVAERTVGLLREIDSIDLDVVAGLSFCDLAWVRLGIDPVEAGVRLVDAERFSVQVSGTEGPLLVAQCWSSALLSDVKLAFDTEPAAPAVLLHHLGLPDEQVVEVPWSEIDRTLAADHLTSLYVPQVGVGVGSELARFAELVRVLRSRCPWDREQTHRSLTRHLLEETYEAIEAIDALGDDPQVAPVPAVAHAEEELGDLLCQVFFHATLAEEEGLFTLGDVARNVHDKLVARHPHVFGDVDATTADAVVTNWERIKQAEKKRTHLFEGVPKAMPALARAAKAERKLSSVGLGWEQTGRSDLGLVAAVEDLVAAGGIDPDAAGAVLLDLARYLAHAGHDPEALVREALGELASWVVAIERAAGGDGADLGALDPEVRLALWRAAVADT